MGGWRLDSLKLLTQPLQGCPKALWLWEGHVGVMHCCWAPPKHVEQIRWRRRLCRHSYSDWRSLAPLPMTWKQISPPKIHKLMFTLENAWSKPRPHDKAWRQIYIYIMSNCTVKSCVSGFSWANNSVNLLHVIIFYSKRLDIAIGIPNGSCIETVCMAHLIGAPVLVKTVALLPRTSRTLYGAFRGCMGVQHGQ